MKFFNHICLHNGETSASKAVYWLSLAPVTIFVGKLIFFHEITDIMWLGYLSYLFGPHVFEKFLDAWIVRKP